MNAIRPDLTLPDWWFGTQWTKDEIVRFREIAAASLKLNTIVFIMDEPHTRWTWLWHPIKMWRLKRSWKKLQARPPLRWQDVLAPPEGDTVEFNPIGYFTARWDKDKA